jgi:hypothetical protein
MSKDMKLIMGMVVCCNISPRASGIKVQQTALSNNQLNIPAGDRCCCLHRLAV